MNTKLLAPALLTAASTALALAPFAASAQARDVNFSQACARGKQMTVTLVGDLLFHNKLVNSAMNHKQGFQSLWTPTIGRHLRDGDVTYGNLEGPVAHGLALTTKQMNFNFPLRVIPDLERAGFDVIGTANNHSLDRGPVGVDRTLDNLAKSGMSYMGTRYSNGKGPLYTVTNQGGIRIGWVSCTDVTNGQKDPNKQVIGCGWAVSIVSELANRSDIDAVIVTPHWGAEKAQRPSQAQRNRAHQFFKAGAIAVIGAHAHVLQPIEKMVVDGKDRLVAYSLGNFVSNQLYYGAPQQTTVVLHMGLTRSNNGVEINGFRHLPAVMLNTSSGPRLMATSETSGSGFLSHIRKSFPSGHEMGANERLVTNPDCR